MYEDVVASPDIYISEIARHCINLDELEIKPRRIKKLSNNINKEWYLKVLEEYSNNLFIHGKLNQHA